MRAAAFFLLFALFGCSKPEPAADPKADPGRAASPPAVLGGGDVTTPGKGPNPAAFPPDDWTHRDLAEHLSKKGVKVEMASAALFDKPERPAAFFRSGDGTALIVYKCRDEKAAKESAGATPEGFIFGRFAMGLATGDATDEKNKEAIALLKRIRDALR